MAQRIKRLAGLLLACLFLLHTVAWAAPAQHAAQGVIDQVFVRAFADSDGDGIGDLNGLTAKLDYLQQLGVSALWLMPIHPSPSYHGYDVTDYRSIHPDYGTMADFSALVQAAHARDIRVLLDIPFNHTSIQHPWFVDSQREDSPYRSWYHWAREGQEGFYPDVVVWQERPWRKRGDSHYYAIFWEGMPDLNFSNPAVRQEALDIARYWLALGADGFRLDATSHIFGEGETSRLQDIAASADFWAAFSQGIKQSHPQAYLLGEAWEPLSKRAELIRGLDSVVNFDVGDRLLPLLKGGGAGASFVQWLQGGYEAYAKANPGYVDAPFLSNHDQNRVASALLMQADKLKAAARILLTLPGNPIVYYGEEIGMAGAKPDEELRTPMLWGEEDPLLTRWRASRYNKRTLPVDLQQQDPDSLWHVYQQMIALRGRTPALGQGGFEPYEAQNAIPIAFWRTLDGARLLVLHNPVAGAQQLKVPHGLSPLFGTQGALHQDGLVTLPGLGSLILTDQREDSP